MCCPRGAGGGGPHVEDSAHPGLHPQTAAGEEEAAGAGAGGGQVSDVLSPP